MKTKTPGLPLPKTKRKMLADGKKMAIVLSALAATLVLLAAGTGLFIWHS